MGVSMKASVSTMVSVEPPPKQGCEAAPWAGWPMVCIVSVEPPPKQGCESDTKVKIPASTCLSGTPAEAGVRDDRIVTKYHEELSQWNPRRSRGARRRLGGGALRWVVSVEPPPKQGCEKAMSIEGRPWATSQWNPRRSRGARPHGCTDWQQGVVSVEPPPKQGCETKIDRYKNSPSCLSGTPAEAGVRGLIVRKDKACKAVSVEPPPKQGCEAISRTY